MQYIGVIRQRAFGIDVEQVDDAAARFAQRRDRRLAEEERRLRIGREQLVPLLRGRRPQRRGEERRGIVDQRIEPAVMRQQLPDHAGQRVRVGQFGLQQQGAAAALAFQFLRQRVGVIGGTAIMQRQIVARRMQGACDHRTDPASRRR